MKKNKEKTDRENEKNLFMSKPEKTKENQVDVKPQHGDGPLIRKVGDRPAVEDRPAPPPSSSPSSPPIFQGPLYLEPINIRELEKKLTQYSKSIAMQKLAFLDYFFTQFTEIALLQNEGEDFSGKLGFGNPSLVTEIQNKRVDLDELSSVSKKMFSSGFSICPYSSCSEEEKNILRQLGFETTMTLGLFSMGTLTKLRGVWLCASSDECEFEASELKKLKSILNAQNFL